MKKELKNYLDFIEQYVYYEASDVVYSLKAGVSVADDDAWVEHKDPKHRKYNLISVKLEWILSGRRQARLALSRSKFRRLQKKVMKRFKVLSRRYR